MQSISPEMIAGEIHPSLPAEKQERANRWFQKKYVLIAGLLIFGVITLFLRSTLTLTISVALLDSFDFYTYALLLYILQKENPVRNFFAFIIPYFAGYLGMGILYLYLGEAAATWVSYLRSPAAIVIFKICSIIMIAVGLGMLMNLLRQKRRKSITENNEMAVPINKFKKLQAKIKNKYQNYSSLKYSFLAIITILTYLPFAFPYLGFVTHLYSYQLSQIAMIAILFGYSCVFILPYLVLFYCYSRYTVKFNTVFSKLFSKFSDFFGQTAVKATLCFIFGVAVLVWLIVA